MTNMKLKFENAEERKTFRNFKREIGKEIEKRIGQDYIFCLFTIQQYYTDKLLLFLMRKLRNKNWYRESKGFWYSVDLVHLSGIVVKYIEWLRKLNKVLVQEGKKNLFASKVRASYLALTKKPKQGETRGRERIIKLDPIESSYMHFEEEEVKKWRV